MIEPKNNKLDLRYNLFIKSIFRYSNKDLLNAIKMCEKADPKFYKYIKIQEIKEEYKKTKVKQLRVEKLEEIYKTCF